MSDRNSEGRADVAYRQLLALIENDDLPKGRLPSEADFAARFGLSRASVREGLARLRAEGRLVSRRGAGSFAVPDAEMHLLRLSAISTPQDLVEWHEFRMALESEIALLGAERRDEQDILALREANEALLQALTPADGVDEVTALKNAARENAAFHSALAGCSHNAKLIDATTRLAAHLFRWSRYIREHGMLTMRERRELNALEHGAIIDAIVARDGERARIEVRRHLLNGRGRVMMAMGQQP
jgi:DNA-binding FadR family transcriptional regulator